MITRFRELVLNHPLMTIATALVLTAALGTGIRHLILDDNILDMMPDDMPSRIILEQIQEEFGDTDFLILAFGHPDQPFMMPENLTMVYDLTEELELLDDVDEVISIASQNRIESSDGFMEVDDLLPMRKPDSEETDDILNYLNRYPDLKQRMLSRDGTYTNITIRPVADTPYHDLVRHVRTVADSMLTGYDIHYAGLPFISGSVPPLMRKDVSILLRVGLAIMVLILLINLRSPTAVAMVLAVILLSLVSMMGILGWLNHFTGSRRFYFTLINSSMPIILLTIANSDGVHIISRFFKEFRKSGDSRKAVEKTMLILSRPIFLTSLTTIVAFLTLVTAPIIPMTGYGLALSFGIAWALILSNTMLPALIILKKWNINSRIFRKDSVLEKLTRSYGRQMIRSPKRVLTVGMVLVVISLIGMRYVNVEVNTISFFKPGNPIRESSLFIDEFMNGSMNFVIKMTGDLKSPETLTQMETIQNYLEEQERVKLTVSIADVIKQLHRVVQDDDPAYEIIPESRDKVNNLFTLYSMSGDPDDFSALVDYDYRIGLINAMVNIISTKELVKMCEETDTFIRQNVDTELTVEYTGMAALFRDFVRLVTRSSIISILASIILIFAVVGVFMKNLRLGILSVIPLTCAVIMNFGLMGLFRIDLTHVTALLTSIIIGVGVDFAVHYISEYRHILHLDGNGDISRRTISTVGYPIMLDVFSNMGFGALLFSTLIPLNHMGGLMIFAMLSTSLGTLTILASVMELAKNRLKDI